MRQIQIFLILLCILFISSCGSGSETIPGLSAILMKALKSGNEKTLKKGFPSSDEMIYLYNTYYKLDYPGNIRREEEAIGKAASIRLSLMEDFRTIRKQGEKLGINWEKDRLLNFNFLKGDHNQGFPSAEVKLIVGNEKNSHELLYTAYQVEGKWYMVDGLQWSNKEQELLAPAQSPSERPVEGDTK